MYSRLLAIDPSLTCSGWALFDVLKQSIIGVGKIRSLKSSFELQHRYNDLQIKIANLFGSINLNSSDILVCEAPTTMIDPRAAFKVEQVRGVFETLARQINVTVPGRVNPRTVQYELMGMRGKQLRREVVKQNAVLTVQKVYGHDLQAIGFSNSADNLKRHQDIVDAILVGSLAVSRVKSAMAAKVVINEVFKERPYRSRRAIN